MTCTLCHSFRGKILLLGFCLTCAYAQCAVQIALDRLGYGPAFNLLMMSFVYKLSGQSWKQVWASLQKTFWSAQVCYYLNSNRC